MSIWIIIWQSTPSHYTFEVFYDYTWGHTRSKNYKSCYMSYVWA